MLDHTAVKGLKPFRDWLKSQGAEILQGTSEYEVLRFRAAGRVGILYTNRAGVMVSSANEVASIAYADFLAHKPLSLTAAAKTTRSKKSDQTVAALVARDGNECWFCGGLFPPAGVHPVEPGKKLTIEHLVPVSAGGPNHLHNLVLAHESCNRAADHASVAEKVRMRDRLRSRAA